MIPLPSPAACSAGLDPAGLIEPFRPAFPDMAAQEGAQGVSVVRVLLANDGAVLAVRLARSAGNAALDQDALVAARNSHFEPAFCHDVGVVGTYRFVVTFAIDSRTGASLASVGEPRWTGRYLDDLAPQSPPQHE